jgi:phosphoribosylformylglycinamidine synthase
LPADAPAHAVLFGEDQARYLVATTGAEALLEAAASAGVPAHVVGRAGGEDLAVEGLFALPLARLRQANEGWMPAFMGDAA